MSIRNLYLIALAIALIISLASFAWAQGEVVLEPHVRPGSGVIVPSPDGFGARLYVNEEAMPIAGTDPAWVHGGIDFPPPGTGGQPRSCIMLETVVPQSCPPPGGATLAGWCTWKPYIQMSIYRRNGANGAAKMNMWAKVTYFPHFAPSIDFRAPVWGPAIDNDVTPSAPGGVPDNVALWQSYTSTIRNIPALETGDTVGAPDCHNCPGPRKHAAFMVCRESGTAFDAGAPAGTTGKRTAFVPPPPVPASSVDESDANWIITHIAIRWQSANNEAGIAVILDKPLVTLNYEPPTQTTALPPLTNGALLTKFDEVYQGGRVVTDAPQFVPIGPQSTGICTIGEGGNYPACTDTKFWSGYELHDGVTECAQVALEVPEDRQPTSPVEIDAVIRSAASSGSNFRFEVTPAFLDAGESVITGPSYASATSATIQRCDFGIKQIITFPNIDMTGASPGSTVALRICRTGAHGTDDAVGSAFLYGVRPKWKRQLGVEPVN